MGDAGQDGQPLACSNVIIVHCFLPLHEWLRKDHSTVNFEALGTSKMVETVLHEWLLGLFIDIMKITTLIHKLTQATKCLETQHKLKS